LEVECVVAQLSPDWKLCAQGDLNKITPHGIAGYGLK